MGAISYGWYTCVRHFIDLLLKNGMFLSRIVCGGGATKIPAHPCENLSLPIIIILQLKNAHVYICCQMFCVHMDAMTFRPPHPLFPRPRSVHNGDIICNLMRHGTRPMRR